MAVEADPDVCQIGLAQTEMRPCCIRADEEDNSFCIVLAETTWTAMQEHAHSRLDAEVGGVMLGKMCRDSRETPYLLINGHVAALAAESRASNVTFTADSWTTIHDTIDRDYPGAQIVGWYHTHPSFGIFLSEMDVFIHRHFFEAPHQVAIVIDPVANLHGGFAWRGGTPSPQKLFIEAGAEDASPVDFRRSFIERELAKEREARVGPLAKWFESTAGITKYILLSTVFVVGLGACGQAMWKWTPLCELFRSESPRFLSGE